jgi:PEGA domain
MAGCATVTRGTTDTISVTSAPSGAQVTTSLSNACTTPCNFDVPRKAEFVVTFNSPGYKPQEIAVKTQVAPAGAAGFVGNAVIGGVVGMGVDVATGATLEHVPNPVHADLEPLPRPSAGPPGPHRLRRAPKPANPAAQIPAS